MSSKVFYPEMFIVQPAGYPFEIHVGFMWSNHVDPLWDVDAVAPEFEDGRFPMLQDWIKDGEDLFAMLARLEFDGWLTEALATWEADCNIRWRH